MSGLNPNAVEFVPEANEFFPNVSIEEAFADMAVIDEMLDKEEAAAKLAAAKLAAAELAAEADDLLAEHLANHAADEMSAADDVSEPTDATPALNPRSGAKPCRFGAACTRPDCWFSHPDARAAAPSPTPAPKQCKWGAACFGKKSGKCPFQH